MAKHRAIPAPRPAWWRPSKRTSSVPATSTNTGSTPRIAPAIGKG
jgi:hypothetical protein